MVFVRVNDNDVAKALRALKYKLQRQGTFKEHKVHRYYEKPSDKSAGSVRRQSAGRSDPAAETPLPLVRCQRPLSARLQSDGGLHFRYFIGAIGDIQARSLICRNICFTQRASACPAGYPLEISRYLRIP
jgi:small subunit ribosomal protein S21